MKPIKNIITWPTVHVWSKSDGYIGEMTEVELLDFRCQIMETKAEGYYITETLESNPIDITPSGRVVGSVFDDFYVYDNLLNRILGI